MLAKEIKQLKDKRNKRVDEFAKEDWNYISGNERLSEEFIREYAEQLNLNDVIVYNVLPEDVIWDKKDELDWSTVMLNQRLSEDTIRECLDYIEWDHIFTQDLSIPFLKEFQDRIPEKTWNDLVLFDELSDEFIEAFADQLGYEHLALHQNLNFDFIQQHSDKLNYLSLKRNFRLKKNLTNEQKEYIHNIAELQRAFSDR